MPIAPPSATGVAAANSETVTPVHYRARHYRYWAAWPPNYAYLPWRGLYEYPRYYWDVYPVPYAHYYVGPYWGW